MGISLTDLTALTKYQNRQVIINYYNEEDFLEEKHGFDFLSIEIVNKQLTFIQKNTTFTLSFDEFIHFYQSNEFQNYYIFQNPTKKVEIYFP